MVGDIERNQHMQERAIETTKETTTEMRSEFNVLSEDLI